MVDILHRVGVRSASVDEVYDALTSLEGLSGWWTTDTRGDTELGGAIEFHFEPGSFTMQVRELRPAERVVWEVTEGPEEWVGTEVTFDLTQDGEWVIVNFAHSGWREPVEFMHHCSTKWGAFLQSLKQLLETGTGAPAPRDVQISNWH